MSGTLQKLIVLACLFGAPTQALAFDFDKEIAKQNRVYTNVTSCASKSEQQKCKSAKQKRVKDVKVRLIAKY